MVPLQDALVDLYHTNPTAYLVYWSLLHETGRLVLYEDQSVRRWRTLLLSQPRLYHTARS